MQIQQAVDCLVASGEYRILRQFHPVEGYACLAEDSPLALILDVETSGLDPDKDRILELSFVIFQYDPVTGRVGSIRDAYEGLEDPGFPLSDATKRLTGLTDEMLKGKSVDRARIVAALEQVSLVIAHNAGFDRKFCENLLPEFAQKAWACSMADVPWKEYGYASSALEYIAYRAGVFYSGHRALIDTQVALHILATPVVTATLPMSELLSRVDQGLVRVWAERSPYDMKDLLKKRGYRWNDGENGKPKAWWTEMPAATLEAELAFLADEVYGRAIKIPVDVIDATVRYSSRDGVRRLVDLPFQAGTMSSS